MEWRYPPVLQLFCRNVAAKHHDSRRSVVSERSRVTTPTVDAFPGVLPCELPGRFAEDIPL